MLLTNTTTSSVINCVAGNGLVAACGNVFGSTCHIARKAMPGLRESTKPEAATSERCCQPRRAYRRSSQSMSWQMPTRLFSGLPTDLGLSGIAADLS